MKQPLRVSPGKVYAILACVTVAVTVALRMQGITAPAWVGSAAGGAILVVACLSLFAGAARVSPRRRVIVAFLAVFLWAAFIEVVGLYTKHPFGSYRYTELWIPYIVLPGEVKFPLFLPLSWTVLAFASYFACSNLKPLWLGVFATAFLATVIDLGLESVMTGPALLWYWLEPVSWFGAPLENFLGWFSAFAMAASIPYLLGVRPTDSKGPFLMLCSVAVLNAVVGAAYSRWPALAGLLVVPILIAIYRLERRQAVRQ